MSVSSFGVRKPVVANLVMLVIIGAGLVFGVTLRREFFPEVRPNMVLIAAPYPGASPEEIDRALAVKIEDAIADIRDIKEINSTVVEGAATLQVEFLPGVAIEDAVAQVKRKIDALQDLPEQSERITVESFEPNIPVINLTLYGDVDERSMKDAIRAMRDDIRTLPDMGDVFVSGVRTDEIAVEVREAALVQHGVGLPYVAERIGAAMAEAPGGAVRSPRLDVTVRTTPIDERSDAIRRIIVKAAPDGRPIRLDEIATVSETFADVDLRTRFQGKPCVSLTAYAVGEQDAVRMSALVKAYAAGRMREPLERTWGERFASLRPNPTSGGGAPVSDRLAAYELGLSRPGLGAAQVSTHTDLARFVSQRLELLSRNALAGGVLVFITLLLFLTPTVAMWVTIGLVISILGTLAAMHFLDVSLNLLTMFGLIIVLGLLVDDAIVVAENITARHERGEPAESAAIGGATQVEWPVVATVLTTIWAFLPLRLIEGRIGDLMGVLPLVVMIALTISLLECLLILPAHMAHSLRALERRRPGPFRRVSRALEAVRFFVLQRTIAPAYARLLGLCLRRRYLTVIVGLAAVIASLGMVAGGRVPFVFFDAADSETVTADLTMPVGTPLAATDLVARQIEAACLRAPEVQSVFAVVGARQDAEGGGGIAQGHRAQVWLELHPVERRERSSDQVVVAIQNDLGPIPGVKSLRFEALQGGPAGPPITLTVAGDVSSERLRAVASAIQAELEEYEGVFGVADDADAGKRELRITLRDGASELGFTNANLALQIRAAVFGLEAHTFAGHKEDVDVRVMLEESDRRSLAAIEAMRVFTPDGRAVPLSEVARLDEGHGYATVRRLDRQRAVTVTADVDRSRANPEQVVASLAPFLETLERDNPGIQIIPRGRQKDLADSFRTLPIGMLAACGLIYVTLAWLFSSYTQPIIVLFAIPFSIIGVVWGHLVMGFDMTILSLIGFVALSGIVVNDALVFINFYNEKRAQGHSVMEAALITGPDRLRAILLTTLTTVLGLAPLMLEQSFQAHFLIPMAITISFGLISATFLTLILLPALLVIGDDIRRAIRWVWTGGALEPELSQGAAQA